MFQFDYLYVIEDHDGEIRIYMCDGVSNTKKPRLLDFSFGNDDIDEDDIKRATNSWYDVYGKNYSYKEFNILLDDCKDNLENNGFPVDDWEDTIDAILSKRFCEMLNLILNKK